MKQLFIIGAQRSGSTYLYRLLDEHPEISMAHPVRPEPKFFLDESRVIKGIGHYLETCFADAKPGSSYHGEKSTSYIESALAAERIRKYFPDARILVILRNPAMRAWSNYCFSCENGLETLSFPEALAKEPERIRSIHHGTSVSPFAYRQRGFYMQYLDVWLAHFPKEQLQVVILEELASEVQQIQSLYNWLGVNSDFIPASLPHPANSTKSTSNPPADCMAELTRGYYDSICLLEFWLGRAIPAWHPRDLMAYEAGSC